MATTIAYNYHAIERTRKSAMTSRLDRVTQERLDKLQRIRELGIDPYPNTFHRSHSNAQAVCLLEESEKADLGLPEVTIAGRLVSRRDMGKITFFDVRDGSAKIQLFCNKANLDDTSLGILVNLDIGDIIGATGTLMRTRAGEPSVSVLKLHILTKSLQPLPEKWHGLQDTERRHRQRYLDLIANTEVRDTFRTRAHIISGIRRYLDGHGFLEVETPVLQSLACGAAARPFITHHNALQQDMYLRIALELHLKRLIVGGFDAVYEIGRIFRNEGISHKHNPEFTMLECYQAYADYQDVMVLVEEMISGIVYELTGGFSVKNETQTLDFAPPWPRLDFREVLLEKSGIDFLAFNNLESLQHKMKEMGLQVDPAKDKGKLLDELLSTYVEPNLLQPCFLIDYPIEMSPLAKMRPGESRVVERFEAFASGMEIANAFSELNDPLEQERRFAMQLQNASCAQQTDDTETIDDDFLTALEFGMPPTGGLGIGIDRLVMLLTGNHSIREVILFPTLKEKESAGD